MAKKRERVALAEGKDFEKKVLDERLKNHKDFNEEMGKTSNTNNGSGSSSSNSSSSLPNGVASVGSNGEFYDANGNFVPNYVIAAQNTPKYANGTTSAEGGLSIVDEAGFGTEMIMRNPSAGRYTTIEKGDAVFSKTMTGRLTQFGLDPMKFLSSILGSSSKGAVSESEITNHYNIVMNGVNDMSTFVKQFKQHVTVNKGI